MILKKDSNETTNELKVEKNFLHWKTESIWNVTCEKLPSVHGISLRQFVGHTFMASA